MTSQKPAHNIKYEENLQCKTHTKNIMVGRENNLPYAVLEIFFGSLGQTKTFLLLMLVRTTKLYSLTM